MIVVVWFVLAVGFVAPLVVAMVAAGWLVARRDSPRNPPSGG